MGETAITDHQQLFELAWNDEHNTAIDLPPVDVNRVLRERYTVTPPAEFTATSLWDMEVRKAKAPDKYIPTVVKPGSLELFPGSRQGRFEDFTRVSEQLLWLDQSVYGVIIEHVRLDHHDKRAFFIGAQRFQAPDGRLIEATTGQPVFHVEHSVSGPEDAPLNLWRIVHLGQQPDPAVRAFFENMGRDPYLRVFNEVYLREDLNRTLTRKP